ncbi:persephin [Triplophysa dalaica]|uniref:persephin n=1 Tax=Triplophysa dalaica TaxID=1582913 RepID=UPI0024DF3885|nr:persephin [Triplophysa dalaica]
MIRSLLKITVLVFCVHAGEGRWLGTLLENRGTTASPKTDFNDEERRGGDNEEKQDSERQLERSPRSAESPCALHSILLQVRDLRLGYDSDEMVLFKYCSGTCPRLPTNHDLTVTNLLQSGILQYTGQWHHQPCCRPTHHEDMVFLDNNHRWHKVEKLSAAECACMG